MAHNNKDSCVYLSTFPHIILIIFLVRIRSDHNFIFFLNLLFLIHLQAVADGKKCSVASCNKFYWLPPYEENTDYHKRAEMTIKSFVCDTVMCSAEGFS